GSAAARVRGRSRRPARARLRVLAPRRPRPVRQDRVRRRARRAALGVGAARARRAVRSSGLARASRGPLSHRPPAPGGRLGAAIARAVTRAEGFVLRFASPLERIYWDTLLRRQDARPLFVALAAAQAPDGAFEPERVAPDADARLAATLRGLTLLDALGVLDHPVPERAASWLLARQLEDGGWSEPGAGAERRIALTGEVAGLLAKTPYARASALARAE